MPVRPKTHAQQVRDLMPQPKRPTTAERGYGGDWQKISANYRRSHPTCEAAGCGRPSECVDHVVSRAKGGSDAERNLMALCWSCHSRKTATLDGAFGKVAIGATLAR